jgi:hypothetical protein
MRAAGGLDFQNLGEIRAERIADETAGFIEHIVEAFAA